MRFFKYLIFPFLLIISSYSYSNTVIRYSLTNVPANAIYSSMEAACKDSEQYKGIYNTILRYTENQCILYSSRYDLQAIIQIYKHTVSAPECWHPDYKIVTQPITGQIKKSICIPNNGVMCKYTSDYIDTAPIINGSISTIFSSVSKTPAVNCKEELLNPPCDPKDPYGGCFTPTDDGCTRQFDGSILCPEEKEPPIKQGCNGADYCKRPPQGCGEGYVSGTFNGQRICIKTKPSSGSGSGSGDGSDGIIGAINKLRDSLIHYSKEIIESIDSMSKKITGKIDDSNVHLDQIEANTLASKNNSQTTNDLLQQIKDKIGSDSSSQNPPTGDGVDLTETNGLLGEIRDGINHIKNVFSDEGKGELEQIGQASNDSRYLNAEANAQSALNALANKLTFGSSACVSDFEIQLPIFGLINIALSQWCSLLALIKILFQLVVLLTCLRMLDATVRTI